LEFEKSRNITGIITGLPTEKLFTGSWFSPKTRKELSLNLVRNPKISVPDWPDFIRGCVQYRKSLGEEILNREK